MHDKSVCLARRLRQGRRGDQAGQVEGLPHSDQLHAVQRRRSRQRVAAFFDDMKALGLDGITVSPGYAYERAPDQQHFLNRDQDARSCSAASFRAAMAAGNGRSASRSCSLNFLAGNQTYHCTPWGNPTAHRVRLAEALLSPGRRLCQDLQGADGRHRVGQIRRRQLREVRRLHGPLRLRGHGREGHDAPSAEGAGGQPARRAHRRRRWPRTSRSTISGRRSSCSHGMSSAS